MLPLLPVHGAAQSHAVSAVVRISKGQELLSSSHLSVTEIAYACGFGDSSHFIQYFRRQTGMTPKEYRRQADENRKLLESAHSL